MSTHTTLRSDQASSFDTSAYCQSWVKSLTEQPSVNPTEINSLQVNIGQAVNEWLLDNAPAEICELLNAQGFLQQYVREYEFSRGHVSATANSNAERAIVDAYRASGQLGILINDEE